MTTDTKAVARWNSWGGEIDIQESDAGQFVLFTDHERVVGELKEHIRLSAISALELDAQNRKELAASRAEVEKLKKDAERWSWIMEGHYGNEPARANRVIGSCWSRKAMEDAIDNDISTQAAMEKRNV